MSATAAGPLGGLTVRESGLIVPAHLAGAPEEPVADGQPAAGSAKDSDDRRRLVLTKDTRKRFTRLAADMDRDDLAFVLVCKSFRYVTKRVKDATSGEEIPVVLKELIPTACGEIMVREGEETHDPGFGCKCTRIHFTRF